LPSSSSHRRNWKNNDPRFTRPCRRANRSGHWLWTLTKDATQADIQKAYRSLAKKLHPDLNPGNTTAEEKFKEISAAYDLLSDPDKRARFDRGEIDASGTERPRQQYYRDFADQGGRSAYTSNAGFADFGDFAGTEDIFSEISAVKAARAVAGGARTSAIISICLFLMPGNPLSCPTAPHWKSTFHRGHRMARYCG
jgi:hypothetical protein